jgi:hypothetical protein
MSTLIPWRWWASPAKPDPEAFHAQLRAAFKAIAPDYDKAQRLRDFKAVFQTGGANEQQAKRVLFQLFEWGFMYTPLPANKPERAEGSRYICLLIQKILNAEPDDGTRPTQTIRDEEDMS